MYPKTQELFRKTEKILGEHEFSYCIYYGCFDIIARKGEIFVIRVMWNIDSLQEGHAAGIKALSSHINAQPLLVGKRTTRECLENGVLYERFGIPALSTSTLDDLFGGALPRKKRFRGGVFVETCPEKFRYCRKQRYISQSGLARIANITKKSVYEHEKKEMWMRQDAYSKIEGAIGDVSSPARIEKNFSCRKFLASDVFEKRVSAEMKKIGFDTYYIRHAPFNIVAKSSIIIFSCADDNRKSIEKKVPRMIEFSGITERPVMVVTKGEDEFDVPTVTESELRDMDMRGIRRLLKSY